MGRQYCFFCEIQVVIGEILIIFLFQNMIWLTNNSEIVSES